MCMTPGPISVKIYYREIDCHYYVFGGEKVAAGVLSTTHQLQNLPRLNVARATGL